LPTVNQAEKLAKSYQRPFAILFLPEPPLDFQPLQDFRKSNSKELSTAVTFIIREIQKKQSWISENNQENNEPELLFVGKYTLNSNPRLVAKDILKTLDINPLEYKGDGVLKEWIDKCEKNGIFVSRTSFIHSHLKLDKEELQGFAIADPFAPFVFINSADWRAPQLFTLVHELAHIWIAETGLSNNVNIEIRQKDKYHPVELFCNEVAASALMPEEIFNQMGISILENAKEVFKLSKHLGVSSFALIVRLLNLGIIQMPKYKSLKRQANIEFKKFLLREEAKKIKQKKNPGDPYLLRLNRNSRLFTQIVLDGFKGGRIEPNLASNLLNVKSNKFNKLEERIYS